MKTTKQTLLLAAALAALSLGCPAEGGDGDGDGDVDAGATDDFSLIYNSSSFQNCAGCHAPGAPGKTAGTEETQNWTTRDTAYDAWQLTASGLIGNFADCNGVSFIGPSAEESLVVAVFDETVRANYTNAAFPDCNADSISDMTIKIGAPLPDQLLADLKAWIDAGAPNM